VSERGSFVTNYIYCDRCSDAVFTFCYTFCRDLANIARIGLHGSIISARYHGSVAGDGEWDGNKIAESFAAVVCHPMRFVIFEDSDAWTHTFYVYPKGKIHRTTLGLNGKLVSRDSADEPLPFDIQAIADKLRAGRLNLGAKTVRRPSREHYHHEAKCAGYACPIHNPSDHAMRDLPKSIRESGLIERICSHGIGHPDPDSVAYFERISPPQQKGSWDIHGCDGCCYDPRATA